MGLLGDILLDQYRRSMDERDLARLAAIQQVLSEELGAPRRPGATPPFFPAPKTRPTPADRRRLVFRDAAGHPTMGTPVEAGRGGAAPTRSTVAPVAPTGTQAPLPAGSSSTRQALERARLMARLGIDAEALRAPSYFDFVQRVQAGEPVNAVLGDFLNRKSIAPFGLSGGVVYGKYGGDIAGESSQVRAGATANLARAAAARAQAGAQGARARLYGEQADEAAMRRRAIEQALATPDLPPLLGVDIAQKKDVFKPLETTALIDGKEVRVIGIPQPNGTIRYRPAEMAGAPLEVPVAAGDDFRQVLAPVAAWSEARKRAAAAAEYRWGRMTPDEQQQATLAEYQASFPGWPSPGEPGFEAGNPLAPRAAAPAPQAQEWQGQWYRTGQELTAADGSRWRIVGFLANGEPDIEEIR